MLKDCFEKVDLKNRSAEEKNACKITQHAKSYYIEVFLIPLYGGNPEIGSFTKSDDPDFIWGGQWLSCRVLDSRLRRDCDVSLSKTH